jgi:microcystin-dependent protein
VFDKLVAFQDWVSSAISSAIAPLRVAPAGTVVPFAGITVPTNWLLCDGTAVSRSTYAALFAALTSNATVTLTIASPCVVSWTGHGRVVGDKVSFETTGALPTGLSVGTNYFVSNVINADSFRVSATLGGADVNTSGTQSGTHTCRFNPHGCGNGTTTFNLPDATGRTVAGKEATATRLTSGNSGVRGNILGHAGGDERLHAHAHGVNDPTHQHTFAAGNSTPASFTSRTGQGDGNNTYSMGTSFAATGISIQNAGAGASQNVQPTIVLNYIIAT